MKLATMAGSALRDALTKYRAPRKARLLSIDLELQSLTTKRSEIFSAPRPASEVVDVLLENTRQEGKLFVHDILAFANRRSGIDALSHPAAIASEIGDLGILQFEASARGLAWVLTTPETLPRLRAALLELTPDVAGAIAKSERDAATATLGERIDALVAEREQLQRELAEIAVPSEA